MEINLITQIYFSPTKTTEHTISEIAQGIQADRVVRLDLTLPQARSEEPVEIGDTFAIIGAPVYGGRIAPEGVRRLRGITGRNTPAVVVVVYGNREYDDALLELRDLAIELGFIPVAGAAFIGEHSYHSAEAPIAEGRPDAGDLAIASQFGKQISDRMRNIVDLDKLRALAVTGTTPYKEWSPPVDKSPTTEKEICTLCGRCAAVCPTAAIRVEKTVETNKSACTLCSACVKNCPTGARAWDEPWLKMAKGLSERCSARKEPEIFI